MSYLREDELDDIRRRLAQRIQTEHGCVHVLSYDEAYDAYYCQPCDFWVEDLCGDHECEYCMIRPVLPSYR